MIVMDNYAVRNKNFMQTIFEVSIQPATGYLVFKLSLVNPHTYQIFKTLL